MPHRDQLPPIIDMTPNGEFRDPSPRRASWLDRALGRIGGVALLLTIAVAGLLMVALAVLFLGLLLPVAVGAGLVAFGTLWWRARRMRAQGVGPVSFFVLRR